MTERQTQGLPHGALPVAGRNVTLWNFQHPPHNRWGLQHVRELAPTRAVETTGQVWPLEREPADLAGHVLSFPDNPPITLDRWLRESDTDGFLVMKGGRVVYERYFNGQQPGTRHLMYSVTKSLTGTLALLLIEQGLVDEAAPAAQYVPELSGCAFGDASVRDLLNMTNSVAYDEAYADPDAAISKFLAAMLPDGEGLCANIRGLIAKQAGFDHGDAFYYVTPTTETLAWILRRVTGRTLADLLGEMIWTPMGAERNGYYWLDFHGVEMGGGGLAMTLRDAARFGGLVLSGGRNVLPASVTERILTVRNREVFARRNPDPWYGAVAGDYHDQWWGLANGQAVCAIGIHGQYLYLNSAAGVVIVKQSSSPDAANDTRRDALTAFAQIAAAV